MPLAKGNSCCHKINSIEFQENSQLETIEYCAFAPSSIENITIPSSVIQIGDSCFTSCKNLKSVIFSENSELRYLGKFAFFNSTLEKIEISPKITKIQESPFAMCDQLKKVDFSIGSKLRTFGKYPFIASSVESITIPSSIINFNDEWCNQLNNLNNLSIIQCKEVNIVYYNSQFLIGKSDPKSDVFDILYLTCRNIEKVVIPSFIKQIAPHAFDGCGKIKTVEFQ